MPKYEVPVDLTLYIKASDPSHAYGVVQEWFNSLLADDFEKFRAMRRDGAIFPSSWDVNVEEIKDLMIEGIEARQIQQALDKQNLDWKIDDSGRKLIGEED